MVARGVATQLLWYPGWLLGCCYAVARVSGRLLGCCYAVAREPGVVLGCCYAVAREPGVVARVLLCGC